MKFFLCDGDNLIAMTTLSVNGDFATPLKVKIEDSPGTNRALDYFLQNDSFRNMCSATTRSYVRNAIAL